MHKIIKRDLENAHNFVSDWMFQEGRHSTRPYICRGVVEYTRDPERRGRVLVRVVEDGPEMQVANTNVPRTATFDLTWCDPLFPAGAGMGFGSFTVPPVGSRVFVLYERGHVDQPLYFGGWYANSPRRRRYGVTKTTITPPNTQHEDEPGFDENGNPGGDYRYPPKPTPYGGHWTEEQGPEIPLELVEMLDHTPDIQMFFKTLKGATMMVKERDEVEEFFLIDRLGSELRFEASTELQEDGVIRRGMNSVSQLEPMGLDSLIDPAQRVSLMTGAGTGLEMESGKHGNDSISLQTSPATTFSKSRARELQATRMAVELDEGEQRLQLLYLEGGTVVGRITFDAVSSRLDIQGLDHIQISSDRAIELEAPQIRVRGDLEIEGEIRHIGGDQMTFVDNHDNGQTRNFWPEDDDDNWDGFRRDEDPDRW
jgi:hypothetical protein